MHCKLTATAELVVPKSMPTTRSEGWVSSCAAQFKVILLQTKRNCRHRTDLLMLKRGETFRFSVIVHVRHKLFRSAVPLMLWGTKPRNPTPWSSTSTDPGVESQNPYKTFFKHNVKQCCRYGSSCRCQNNAAEVNSQQLLPQSSCHTYQEPAHAAHYTPLIIQE